MNVCGVDRLKLTPNVDNEFIFTIKENGKLTPMPISVSGQDIVLSTKEYSQDAIINYAAEATSGTTKIVEIGFPYAAILGVSRVIKSSSVSYSDTNPPPFTITNGVLWQNTTNNKLYRYDGTYPYAVTGWLQVVEKIKLNSVELTIQLSYDLHVSDIVFLEQVKVWAVSLGYTTKITGNILEIEKNNDFAYTTSSGMSSRTTQEYTAATSANATTYTMKTTERIIDVGYIPNGITENIKVKFSFPIKVNDGLLVSEYVLTNSGNGYPTSFKVTMEGNTTPQATITKLVITASITSSGSDSFVFKLIRLNDNSTIDLVKIPTVVDATGGKIGLIITASEVNILISRLGEEVDRYYMKHVYRLLLEATTKVNGSFIAEIRKVSVG